MRTRKHHTGCKIQLLIVSSATKFRFAFRQLVLISVMLVPACIVQDQYAGGMGICRKLAAPLSAIFILSGTLGLHLELIDPTIL